MPSLTENLQIALRNATGTTLDLTGDFHAYCTQQLIPTGHINERVLALARTSDSSIGTAAAAWNYFLSDPSRIFNPLSLFSGGNGVWYDPSDLSTMWQDTAGTIPAVVNSLVARIDDKSGSGRNGTQAVAGQCPILRLDAGLRPYLEFDGVDDLLVFTTFGGSQTTIAVVGSLRSAAGAVNKIGFEIANQVIYMQLAISQKWGGLNTAEVTSSSSAASNNKLVMIERSRAANDVDLFTNGVKEIIATGTVYQARPGSVGGHPIPVQLADMDCWGILGIDRLLTDLEVANLNAWDKAKAGIP